MKFAVDRPVKILVLGAGGTAGYAIPHLYRLCHALDRPVKITVADGDIIESKNLVRQNFIPADLGCNKAQTLAQRYSAAFGMETLYVPDFIEDEGRLTELVKPDTYLPGPFAYKRQEGLSILVGCVDNNKSRQLCHKVFMKTDNLVYLDSGNGLHTGQIVLGVRRSGRTYYKSIGSLYPDVLEDTDKYPSELSCAEAAVSAPQSIIANILAASVITNYLYNILVLGSVDVRSVTFSSKSINIKPIISQKRRKVA